MDELLLPSFLKFSGGFECAVFLLGVGFVIRFFKLLRLLNGAIEQWVSNFPEFLLQIVIVLEVHLLSINLEPIADAFQCAQLPILGFLLG